MPEGYLVADVQLLPDPTAVSIDPELISNVQRQFGRYQHAIIGLTGRGDPVNVPELPSDPVKLSYWVAAALYVDPHERQRLLETDEVGTRLQLELELLKREMPKTIGPFSLN
jgi:hypothetical protein